MNTRRGIFYDFIFGSFVLPPTLTVTGSFDFSVDKLPTVLETEFDAARRGMCCEFNGMQLHFINAVAYYLRSFFNCLEGLFILQWLSQSPNHISLYVLMLVIHTDD